jgi:hypothetical protein
MKYAQYKCRFHQRVSEHTIVGLDIIRSQVFFSTVNAHAIRKEFKHPARWKISLS